MTIKFDSAVATEIAEQFGSAPDKFCMPSWIASASLVRPPFASLLAS